MTGGLVKKEKFGYGDRHPQREDNMKTKAKAGNTRGHQKLGERPGTDSPSQPTGGASPAETLILDV